MKELQDLLQAAVKTAYDQDEVIELTRTEEQFGDFATNIALQLSKKVGANPREVAAAIIAAMPANKLVSKADIAGPGFINLTLHDDVLLATLAEVARGGDAFGKNTSLAGKTVVAEYSDPNPFKVLHAGHLYTSMVGDTIANILEATGAKVHRVNFGGDVGLHVGQNMWAIIQNLDGEHPEKLQAIKKEERADWLAARYREGNTAYEEGDDKKSEIIALNKRVYQLHESGDHDSPFAQIYWICRQWSYEYLDEFYASINCHFEKYYPESEAAPIGLKTVKQHLGTVFEESDGAVVFRGEKYGLHTRVFITQAGLPTYEAKDVGLIIQKHHDYKFDTSIVITGNEQLQYMEVVLKAIEQFSPELVQNTTHITHGLVKLEGGVKMSSRKGNVLKATEVLAIAAEANKKATGSDDMRIVLGAVRYSFLKQRLGGDIVYSPTESVSLEGNSGPYLQYAYARARAITRKATEAGATSAKNVDDLQPAERSLLKKISEYPEVVAYAAAERMPHHVCSYLYELAQVFNRFYEQARIIGDPRQAERLALLEAYQTTLKNGLVLLGIPVLEQM